MSLINPTPPLEGSEPQTTILDEDDTPLENKWVRIARQIYDDSTEYLDANIRYQWEKSLSLFNSEHPPGSNITQALTKKDLHFLGQKQELR